MLVEREQRCICEYPTGQQVTIPIVTIKGDEPERETFLITASKFRKEE